MNKSNEPGKRKLQMTENRNRILETSKLLFKEKGYEATTMSDIIEISGLSNGTIYNMYPSKKDILLDIYKTYVDVPLCLNDNYEEKVRRPKESIVEFFEDYIRLWLDVGWSVAMNIYHALSVKRDLSGNSTVDPVFNEQKVKTELRGFIKHAQNAGTMTQYYTAEEIEELISTQGRGMLYLWGLSKGEYDFIDAARHQFPILLSTFVVEQ